MYLPQLRIMVVFLFALAACGGSGSSVISPPVEEDVALIFTPIAFDIIAPTTITHADDDSARLFLVEQSGAIRILLNGTVLSSPFLDISERLLFSGERGLLGLAFPPDFALKGYFYVNYTRVSDGATVVSRFFVSPGDPDVAIPGSEEILLTVPQPFANHNGGQLAFGSDGFLYIGLGDGGSGGDPQGYGQNSGSLLGKLLRIDVEAGISPYQIPDDNPFVDDPGTPDEIWATGLRNPWRFSFDRLNGDLFLADVGQNRWEEINHQPVGADGGVNFGWNILEGPDCFNPVAGCVEPPNYAPPVAFYNHDSGCSVTGGYVYRGPGNVALQGRYLYGDFCNGRIWGLEQVAADWENTELALTGFSISAFGEDEEGRLYLADYTAGIIYRIDQQ